MELFNNEEKGKRKFLIPLLIIIGIWIFLAILFGIYDLVISQTVYDPQSGWANFGEDWGQIPSYFLIGIAFLIFLILLFTNKDTRLKKELFLFSILVILLAVICPLFIVQTLKFFVRRKRFECLGSGYFDYTPWFASPIEPSYSYCYTSFPSGHTSKAFMFIPLIVLFRDSWLKWFAVAGSIAWGIFVASSRVVIGAHYASDVLFSAFFSVIITIVLYIFLYGQESEGHPFCNCVDDGDCWCRWN